MGGRAVAWGDKEVEVTPKGVIGAELGRIPTITSVLRRYDIISRMDRGQGFICI